MFDIRFISRTSGRRPITSRESMGKITLEDFDERFTSDLSYWQPQDYERQWTEAVRRLVGGEDSSALITSVVDPATPGGLIWWPMYRVGPAVYVRNAMLLFDKLDRKFDPASPYSFVPERGFAADDEYPPSEWSIRVNDLQDYLSRANER
jgi:hypothetical protein